MDRLGTLSKYKVVHYCLSDDKQLDKKVRNRLKAFELSVILMYQQQVHSQL